MGPLVLLAALIAGCSCNPYLNPIITTQATRPDGAVIGVSCKD